MAGTVIILILADTTITRITAGTIITRTITDGSAATGGITGITVTAGNKVLQKARIPRLYIYFVIYRHII
jgi:hypothetical protein